MDRLSLEVKVGMVVTAAVMLVLAFLLLLSDWNPFTNTYRITMTLNYAGGIKPGADVNLAGAKVGKVDYIRFPKERSPDRPVLELELLIDKRAKELICEDSNFSVYMESLLGGKIVEITPGSVTAKVLEEGAVIRGADPPQLENLINEGISLLDGVKEFMGSLAPEDRERLKGLLASLSRLDAADVDQAKRLLANAAAASEDLKGMVSELRPEVGPMLADVRSLLGEAKPIAADARRLIAKVDRTLTELRAMAPSDPAAARAKVDELLATADQLNAVMERLDGFTARMQKELKGVDRRELERIVRQFLQQEGVTINVKKIYSDPGYPPPPPASSSSAAPPRADK